MESKDLTIEERAKFTDSGDLVPVELSEKDDTALQEKFWNYYVMTVIEGEPNAYKSAIKAGYAEDSALKITAWKWFRDRKKKLDRIGMLRDAERNFQRILNTPFIVTKQRNGEQVEVIDIDLMKIVLDTSKTIAKSLGKDEGYSERSEFTGKGGDPIVFMPAELISKFGLDKDGKR